MPASSLTVRPLSSAMENAQYFQLAGAAFSPQPSEEGSQRWQRYITGLPEFRPEQLRGAFRDGELVGGYMLYERVMRLGSARVPTGCIGIVVTHPAHRHQGIARAMMEGVIVFARARGHVLLLLDGIPKFYSRYGYIDVIDLSTVEIDRSAILAQGPGPYTTRRSVDTSGDAEALLSLYLRHYGSYTGSFERSLEYQVYRLRNHDLPVLALAPGGEIRGYLSSIEENRGEEIAADNWEATQALLFHHASSLPGEYAPATLRYRLPPSSPLIASIVDHLEIPDTSRWVHPADEWSLKTEIYQHRDAGWMARLLSLPTLLQAILPELQARWRRSLAHWTGAISLAVGEEEATLRLDGRAVLLAEAGQFPPAGLHTARLTPQAFTQMVFGYHPVELALGSDTNDLPDEVISALSVLFPPGHAWIARSDWF